MTRRFARLAAIAIASFIAGPHAASAQVTAATPPTLAIVPFESARFGLTREDGEGMANDLGTHLVESGRYRVMGHEWLPIPANAVGHPSVRTLRQAATQAGVEYLVLGTMSQSSYAVRQPAPILARPLGILGGRFAGPRANGYPRPPVVTRQTRVTLDVTVIDAGTGEIVRTITSRSDAGSGPAMKDLADALLRLAPALTRIGR